MKRDDDSSDILNLKDSFAKIVEVVARAAVRTVPGGTLQWIRRDAHRRSDHSAISSLPLGKDGCTSASPRSHRDMGPGPHFPAS